MSEMVETSDEWIQERTGIRKRRIAAEGEFTSDLGYEAALAALQHAGLTADDIDLIVVATSTPDLTFPSTATIIQEKLDMRHGAAFDIQAVCSGFIYGTHVVNALLKSGGAKRAILIGAETFSRILDWTDRGTCVLFGDGAGAIIVEAVEDTESDWFVPHQANQRILNAVAKRLKLRPGQVVSTVDQHANTSAASVPLAMDAAVKDGRIKKGDLVMLEAFGGGFTWGAALLRY